jgi:RimJ/RimL family protein N-acetyltransferase
MIETVRLRLYDLADRHREPFAEMHSRPEVMADLGGPIDRIEADAKFDRYLAARAAHGVARWAVEDRNGIFLGYCGVMPRCIPDHPLGSHFEVGWRFKREAWGNGYAYESARAALDHAQNGLGLTSIVSYTGIDNIRSQSVMRKLALIRDTSQDFTLNLSGKSWHGMVWVVPVDETPLP